MPSGPIQRAQLEKLATSLGLQGPHGSLYDLVLALVHHVLDPLGEGELEAIMALRAAAKPPDLPPAVTPEVMAEVAGTDAAKDLKVMAS
eukprot:8796107-Lingulodinium_polyedra.AAC.1